MQKGLELTLPTGVWLWVWLSCTLTLVCLLPLPPSVVDNVEKLGENIALEVGESETIAVVNLDVTIKRQAAANFQGDMYRTNASSVNLPPSLFTGTSAPDFRVTFGSFKDTGLFTTSPGSEAAVVGSEVILVSVYPSLPPSLTNPVKFLFSSDKVK